VPKAKSARTGGHGEHVAGLRITAICTDLQIFHRTRKTAANHGRDLAEDRGRGQRFPRGPEVQTEDFGATIFRWRTHAGEFYREPGFAGRKNRPVPGNYGIRASAGVEPGAARMNCGSAAATCRMASW